MNKHVLDIAARDITQLIHSTINRPYEVAVAGGAVRDKMIELCAKYDCIPVMHDLSKLDELRE